MGHVTDTLWNTYIPKLRSATILVMGTAEAISTKIHVDHMIDRLVTFGGGRFMKFFVATDVET